MSDMTSRVLYNLLDIILRRQRCTRFESQLRKKMYNIVITKSTCTRFDYIQVSKKLEYEWQIVRTSQLRKKMRRFRHVCILKR